MTSGEPNPVLVKELRGRMRGGRAFVILSVYLAFLACFACAVYYSNYVSSRGPGGALRMAPMGRPVFYAVVAIELFMVAFLTPAFVTGAISSERERQTYELLRTTLLPARALVLGKLLAALSYVVLLVLVAVPVHSLAFVLGGVPVVEIALALLILLVAAIGFATLGMFASSMARSTLAATVLTYVTILVVTIVLPLATGALALVVGEPLVSGYGTSQSPAMLAVLVYLVVLIAALSPFTAAIGTELVLLEEQTAWGYWQSLGDTQHILIPSPWIVFLVLYLLLSALLLAGSIARVGRQADE
jgi:ABC-type transport system involved in multi-copper enzyme maturation permease subunit